MGLWFGCLITDAGETRCRCGLLSECWARTLVSSYIDIAVDTSCLYSGLAVSLHLR